MPRRLAPGLLVLKPLFHLRPRHVTDKQYFMNGALHVLESHLASPVLFRQQLCFPRYVADGGKVALAQRLISHDLLDGSPIRAGQ